MFALAELDQHRDLGRHEEDGGGSGSEMFRMEEDGQDCGQGVVGGAKMCLILTPFSGSLGQPQATRFCTID